MKTFSVKHLKKSTRTICEFGDKKQEFSDTTTVTTGDTTTSTITVTTSTHLK